jgi:hypothetical protein
MREEIQQALSDEVRGMKCQDCGTVLNFDIVVFPTELKNHVIAVARATHCEKRYIMRARLTSTPTDQTELRPHSGGHDREPTGSRDVPAGSVKRYVL